MSTQNDAIRDYFHENGISNRDVAERLGAHEGSVSNILSGRYGISKKIAARLTTCGQNCWKHKGDQPPGQPPNP